MSTAQVQVLHAFIAADGAWRHPSPELIPLPADEARQLESTGKVDVLSVDGKVEVWPACCNGEHDH